MTGIDERTKHPVTLAVLKAKAGNTWSSLTPFQESYRVKILFIII